MAQKTLNMALNTENVEIGTIALIQQDADGRITQIGIRESQSRLLQIFLAGISEGMPFVKMPEENDLVLKKLVCKKCKTK